MTTRVRLTGWAPGLKKVSLTKSVRELANLPLDQAHDAVDRLLAGQNVDLVFSTEEFARRFADDARTLGAAVEGADTQIPVKH